MPVSPRATKVGVGVKNVAFVDSTGKKLGEFDEVRKGLFIEDKAASIAGIRKGLKFTGKTFDQAALEWAISNIFKKTNVRILNLSNAVRTLPEEGGTRIVPVLSDIKNIRKIHFRISGNDPILIRHVQQQLEELRSLHPDWIFTVEFGQ